jgi:hypothetical protein
MTLNDFVKNLYTRKGNYGNVVSVSTHYTHQIIENDNGKYFVDGVLLEADYSDLEEVKRHIELEELAKVSLYEDISDIKIANIIKKYNENTKITTTLIESYTNRASSKAFDIDPVLIEMRTTYRGQNLMQNKLDFILNDGKTVAISEETVEKIANLLNNSKHKEEILNYMKECVENFLYVVRKL